MPHIVKGTNLAQAYVKSCEAIVNHGEKVQIDREHVQDNGTTELCPTVVVIDHPEYSTLVMEERAPNPFATLFEAMWIVASKNDVETLKYFIPRAPDYADNGTHWRAGYGTRLRQADGFAIDNGYPPAPDMCNPDTGPNDCVVVDQIEYIIKTLEKDPSSRRAIMTIWDPAKEHDAGNSKDYPCNIALQFIIRNNKLNLVVNMRSNDVLFGFSGINVYEWAFIQTMIAARLGRQVGWYEHHATSFHVYDNMLDKVEKCASAKHELNGVTSFLKSIAKFEVWNSLDKDVYAKRIGVVQSWIENIHLLKDSLKYRSAQSEPMTYLGLYILFKEDKKAFAEVYVDIASTLTMTDMLKATIHYFNRNTKGIDSSLDYMNTKGGKFCAEEVCRKILESE